MYGLGQTNTQYQKPVIILLSLLQWSWVCKEQTIYSLTHWHYIANIVQLALVDCNDEKAHLLPLVLILMLMQLCMSVQQPRCPTDCAHHCGMSANELKNQLRHIGELTPQIHKTSCYAQHYLLCMCTCAMTKMVNLELFYSKFNNHIILSCNWNSSSDGTVTTVVCVAVSCKHK